MMKLIICLIFAIFCCKSVITSTKLNYPRVLLPIFDKISINFTLEVIERGCFKWISSRQDLILITPLYDDTEIECSYQATVTVVSRERQRNTVIVLAEDLSTGESLRCDVILDVIDKLGVTTTTRQLYLEEAPETFVLRAEDSQGNAFTTLEGVEFHWSIESLNSVHNDLVPALRFLTFTESSYHEVPSSLEKFESQGRKGYKVLLEGINTGTAKVTVSMPYPEYRHVPIIETYISVLANIILEPSDIYMLTGDTIEFRIFQLKMGKLTEISLNNQYYLEVEDEGVATMWGTSVTGQKIGRTLVVLRDRNVPNDNSFMSDQHLSTQSSVPSARLTVAEPKILKLNLFPHNNWLTVVGEKHEIAVDLYTKDNQKITLGSGYAVHSELDEMLFYVYKRSDNGSRLYGETIREGVTPVYGSFKELTAQAELQIFRELSLVPKKVILPYDPNIKKTQQIQFRAQGGDGSYVWHTLQPRLLSINSHGLAATVVMDTDTKRTQFGAPSESNSTVRGLQAHVRVALAKNHKIFRQADVYFAAPIKLKILKYNFETALQDYVHLHVAVYAQVNKTVKPLTFCENLVLDCELSQPIFQVDNNYAKDAELMEEACQVLHLRSTAIGLTQLKLSYKYQDKVLKDEATLHVYEPLSVVEPKENAIILPIGAASNIIYINGPQRIYTLAAELTKHLTYDGNVATVKEIEFDDNVKNFYAFTILCRQVGSMVLTFNVFNVLLAATFEPYIAKVITTVDCVKPRFLNLYANEPIRTSCPMEMKKTLLQLKERNDKFHIEVEVQDVKNHKLMNISSLLIDWEFAAGNQPYRPGVITYHIETEERLYEGVRLPGTDILVITLNEGVGQNFRIKGTVIGYVDEYLRKENIYPEVPPFGIENPKTGEVSTPLIENEIRFMTVNSTIFMTDHVSIFMAKNKSQKIPLMQGSGFYEFHLSEKGIVQVELQTQKREIILNPLRTGHTRLELHDLCLMDEPAYLSISVVSIGAIRVQAPDRVERTKSIEAIIQLFDTYDNPLQVDPFNLQIYELTEEIFSPHILSVQLGDQQDLNVGEIRYILTGNNLGDTKVIFSAGSGDLLITSEPLTVQVFPPLRLYPRNSTLVVGSSLQIYHHGGPQPDANIVYSVHDKKLISIESAIVTALKLGQTKITGKCVMINPGSGKDVVVSEDTIDIEVVLLSGIQLKTPLIRIRSGAIMPAAIWGTPDLSPLILGTLNNMQVRWSTNQPDVISIYNTFAGAGIEYEGSDLISVRIKALNPGKAKITVSVQLAGGRKLTDDIEVVVFKILALESPKYMTTDSILMPPSSAVQLKVNLDDAIYRMTSESNNIVTVEHDGVIHSREVLGRDSIIAKTFDQSLAIGVEVKDVQYIMASLDYPSLKLRQTESKIPSGTNIALKISLHDNLGNEFAHSIGDAMGLKYELSHKDMVDVQIGHNLTIMINLPRETNNMIAISLKDSIGVKHAEDYIKLSVADSKHIYPIKTIFSVGDIICFESPLSSLLSYWSSSDEHILSIDKHTGVGQVLGNRYKLGEKVLVINGDRVSGNFIKYDVEVRDADMIQFAKSFDIFSGTVYRAHFVIRHHLQHDKLTNLIAKNITKCVNILERVPIKLFKCQLKSKQELGHRLLEHYTVTPLFDVEVGRYACEIALKSHFNEVLAIVKTNDVQFDLEVTLGVSDLTDVLSLKFVPGIKVMPDILMSDNLHEQDLTITGLDKVLQKVEVKASDESLLKVTLGVKAHGLLQYKIKVLKDLPSDEQLFVHVYSANTLQDIQIPFIGTAITAKCSYQPFVGTTSLLYKILSYVGLVITLIVLLIVTIWVYLYWYPSTDAHQINAEVFSSIPKESKSTPPSPSKSATDITHSYVQRESPQNIHNLSPGNDYLVYGDATLVSPQRRLHRRYL